MARSPGPASALLIMLFAACGTLVGPPGPSGPDTAELNAPSPTPMPQPSPTLRPGQRYATYTDQTLGWSVEYPATWTVSKWPGGAAFTSYDPATAPFERPASFESALAIVPPTEIRVHVEVWPNDVGATLTQYVDAWVAEAPRNHVSIISRSAGFAANQPSEVVQVSEGLPTGRSRNAVWIFVVPQGTGRAYLIRGFPAESAFRQELDRILATFRTL